jgi:two-component sensor histidine kinase
VASRGEGIIAPDVLVDERHFKGVDEMTGLALRSILTVPLRAREKVIGVLQVVDTRVNRFNSADLALLESLAATAAIAIENARLYEQARQDAETKSALLAEVNHRVKNNLSAIVGLLYAEQRHAGMENQPIYQIILYDLINRVQGLATVHSMLSAAEWAPLSLADLALQVIHSSLQALPRDRHITVTVNPAPIRVTPQQAHNLALVINELATNTVQHAMAERTTGQIAVKISLEEGTIRCELRDNGLTNRTIVWALS